LSWLTFAAVKGASKEVFALVTEGVERIPKRRRRAKIRSITDHAVKFAVLYAPEFLAAKLKVSALLVNAVALVSNDKEAVLG